MKNHASLPDRIRSDTAFRHDINNHLMTIHNYAQILAEDLPEGGKHKSFASHICASTEAILEMVNEKAGKRLSVASQKMTPASILVVDDQPEVLALISVILEDIGYAVKACNGPFEAIEILAEQAGDFDLIVADFTMPGMNGTELANRVRRDYPDLPFVIVSGQEMKALEALKKTSQSIREVVRKPVIPAQLFEAVEKALN